MPTPPPSATASARAAITTSLTTLGSAQDTKLQQRAADLHANSAAIAKQEKELAKQTAALGKESKKWQAHADKATKRLNEVGDVQNWAECIERELLVLEETMRLVEGREEGEWGEERVVNGEGRGMDGDGRVMNGGTNGRIA